ncbi:MAG: GNAT family N-acetyltransferase [Terracidiphilus sp.]
MTNPTIPATPLVIRLATEADLVPLIALINSAFAMESFFEGPRTDVERLTETMRKGEILVYENDACQLPGCVYIENRGQRGYLGMLAIDPLYQGRGLARPLMAAGEERLRQQGCEAVDITVLSMRPELPPIYRRYGYSESGTEEFHSSRPLKPGVECHCIVMCKRL